MSNIWSKEETLWSFALYGTAVGAGTLFLPIQLGSAGAVVLFITALVAWPLTYWPHKALCQFILSSKTSAGEGITGAVTHYYGKKIGNLITTLYFIAFFVVVLIYAVAITNSLTEQLAKHMVIDLRIRMLVSLCCINSESHFSDGTSCHYSGNGIFGIPIDCLFLISFHLPCR